jgi:L-glyceraldehyde reductase
VCHGRTYSLSQSSGTTLTVPRTSNPTSTPPSKSYAYLIHWPVAMRHDLGELEPYEPGSTDRRAIDHDAPGIEATWKEMVRIYKETQKVRSIGVSNFTVEHLQKVIDATGVVPAFNQIECHPGLIQQELFDYCRCPR